MASAISDAGLRRNILQQRTPRRRAAELVALAPDVILAYASTAVAALQQVTRTVPVVFASVTDPVGAGFVESLARPGGNITGFTLFEYSISAKWLCKRRAGVRSRYPDS